MSSAWIVPALDKLEDGNEGLGLCAELPPVEQLTFQCGKEALTRRIIASITTDPMDRSDLDIAADWQWIGKSRSPCISGR